MASNNKQVLFAHNKDTLITALTPNEDGLPLDTVIAALVKVRDSSDRPDRLTVIFENAEEEASWTIQGIAFDREWVRLF